MSRVKKPNKFINTTKYDSSLTGPSKKVRIHCEGEDYHKAKTLSHWLFVKYNMSYKTYRSKSKNRRHELRKEFEADTGICLNQSHSSNRNYDYDYEYDSEYMSVIADMGVPFSPDGTPLGI